MSDIDLLFLANGHGEDAIGARIAAEFRGVRMAAIPLVGTGRAFRAAGVPVLGEGVDAPSGGWGLRQPGFLTKDLVSWTWLPSLLKAVAVAETSNARLAVAVGDLLPAAFAVQAGLPTILVGCNKTDHYTGWGESYLSIDVAALRAWGIAVLPRDEATHRRLATLGLASFWLGNPMVDLVENLPPPGRAVALLPGSRADARANLPLMLEAARLLGLPAHVALAPGLEDLEATAREAGASTGELAAALAPAGIVLGTSGTASEVAAAHGRPVVAFAGPGPQFTAAFAFRQKDLLGAALILAERTPAAIAGAARDLLDDAVALAAARRTGLERIGSPGGARAVAAFIRSRLPE